MSTNRVCRDVETGLPKWVFTPKTFDPRPTWLKTPWTTVEKIRAADEELHHNILLHGKEAFMRHVGDVEKQHVEQVRAMEAELDKGILKKIDEVKELLEWKFQKLVEKTVTAGVDSLTEQMAHRLTSETQKAAMRWMGEEEELKEDLEAQMDDQIQKIEDRKETEIEAKKVEAMGIWDGELERIRIFEEAKTRKIHREDMTELCEGIWDRIEYLHRRMEASTEAARRRGVLDFERDAANRRRMNEAAGGAAHGDGDEGDEDDENEDVRREKERRELETRLMNMSAGAKEKIDHLKTAIGDVVKERIRAERNVGKVLEAFRRFADVGLGVIERDLGVDDRFEFLLKDPVMFVNPREAKGGCERETEELRMVDGCANLWGWMRDWMMERVRGAMSRKKRHTEEEDEGSSNEEEDGKDGRSAKSAVDEDDEDPAFDDEAVAKKVFDDLLRETIDARGCASTDELLRKLSSRILTAMLSEDVDDRIEEELDKAKRPPAKRGEWEMAAVDCMDGNRVFW